MTHNLNPIVLQIYNVFDNWIAGNDLMRAPKLEPSGTNWLVYKDHLL